MKRLQPILSLALLGAAAFTTPALAHLPPGEYGSFAAGISHPLFGLDHILAMVAVGLWASTQGQRALWVIPAAFVSVMLIGFGLALLPMSLPFVEPMILASTIVLGLVVAMAVKLDIRFAAALVGLFALFHGHAHGGELGEAGAIQFGVGFMLATALLHGVGIGIGFLIQRIGNSFGTSSGFMTRGFGALTAFAGLVLAIG